MISIELIKDTIEETLGTGVVEGIDEGATPAAIVVKADKVLAVCKLLYSHDSFYFDFLSAITGIDNGPEAGTMEVVYNIYSITKEFSLMVKVFLDRKDPAVESVTSVWRGADWQERETHDFFGINFIGHPDLRRILLPADWEGHPMLKDYQEQTYYHGITVRYED